jgi:hypothetical protein
VCFLLASLAGHGRVPYPSVVAPMGDADLSIPGWVRSDC